MVHLAHDLNLDWRIYRVSPCKAQIPDDDIRLVGEPLFGRSVERFTIFACR